MNVAQSPAEASARERLLAYLPRTLVERWARDARGAPIWHESIAGSLMHCDMSGFTAMSERLAGRGKEGAELMAGVLNRFFTRMLGLADSHGGLQMKFGGDAMLLLFSGEDHAGRAAACAIDMQRAMAEFKDVEAGGERHRLRMRAGIHSGRFLAASVGEADGLLHYLLVGDDVSYTTAVEAAAPLDATAISAPSAALLGERARLVQHEHLWRLRSITDVASPPARPSITPAPEATLRRYLMPPLAAADAHFAAEHRRVTAIFINLLGIAELIAGRGDAEAVRQADAYVKLVIAGLERHGGFLAASDASEHGDKLIVLFGAPASTGRDESGALRFVAGLQRDLGASGLDLRHKIGVSTGFVFAGEIGSPLRREYTAIGDSVNLAARLMAAAPEGVAYVSGPTIERAGEEFVVSALKPMSVKGKAAPVRAFRLEGVNAPAAPVAMPGARALLAREEEMARLLDSAAAVVRARRAAWAFVFGEPGIGKSAFIAAAQQRLVDDGWRVLFAHGLSHRAKDVFAAWQAPLHELFGINDGATDDAAWRSIDEGVARLAPEERPYAPLVAGLLSVPAEEGPLLQFLDARARRERLARVMRALLAGEAHAAPLMLCFDDAHLCDGPSLELLAEVIEGLDAPVFLCLSSRATLPPEMFVDREPALRLELRELPADAARSLAAATAALDGERLDALLARAGGNPLFVQELALTGARGSDMPETVNDVILARLDQLPGAERRVLRAAAVVGTEFAAHLVRPLLGALDGPGFARAIGGLEAGGFITSAGPDAHEFRHPLAQEVVYDTLPFGERRSMHGHVAREIERDAAEHLDQVAALLLHHFDRADNPPKTVVYAARSGDRASRAFANREAIEYYTRGLTALAGGGDVAESDRSVLLERIGHCLETQGRHTAATEALIESLERWRARRASRRRLLALDVAESARESVLCRRVAVSFERSSAYDEALRWLEQALASLPLRGGRTTAEIYAAKSVTLYRKGEYGDAIAWGRKALTAARRTGESDVIAYAENMIAQSYMAEGSLRLAVRHLREAVRLYDAASDAPGQAAAHNNLGSCYQLMGQLDDARKQYEIALDADQRVGDLVDIAIIHNNIGEILLIQGAIDEARSHLQRVIEAHGQHEELTAVAGLSYVNLSRCALVERRLDDAMRDVRHGLRLLRGVGARGLATEARMQLAETLLASGDVSGAQREAQRALKDAQSAGERLLEARGERIVGLVRAALGGIDSAAIHLATSAGLARRIGAGHEEARSLMALARLRIDAGGRPRAGGLRRATMIFERMNAAPDLAEARRLMARLEEGTAS
jgi:class 3 adenylate cyclase/predicted ATPase